MLRARSHPEEFAFRIDTWTLVRKSLKIREEKSYNNTPQSDTNWKRLIALAQASDADPWRNSIRSMIGLAKVPDVLQIANAEKELANQPARSLYLLALVIEDARGRTLWEREEEYLKESIRLLKKAWILSPNDFYICRKLSLSCPDETDRLRFATAAVTAGPQFLSSHETLWRISLPTDGRHLFDYVDDAKAGEEPAERKVDAVKFEFENGDTVYFYPKRYSPVEDTVKLSEAIASLENASKSNPDSVSIRTNLAVALVRNNEPEKAVAVCQAIAKLDPNLMPSAVIGRALYGMGQLDLAMTLFEKDISDAPNGNHDYSTLGAIFHERGIRERAFEAFRKAFLSREREAPWGDELFGYYSNRKNVPMETTGTAEEVIATYRFAMQVNPATHRFRWIL